MKNKYDTTVIDQWLKIMDCRIDIEPLEPSFTVVNREIIGYKIKKHRYKIVNIWRKLTDTEEKEPIYDYIYKYNCPYGK